MLSVVVDEQARIELATDLDELFREGARRMLAAALEAEVEAYLAAHTELVDEHGHRLVVRNGHAPARTLATGVGQVEVARPRVDDRRLDAATGQRVQFHSVILPRWCRRSPKVAEVLPLLYLHGLSSLDFAPALERFFGAAAGLSASVVTRLTAQWQAEREAFLARDLADRDYVYCWADGIHFNLRLEDGRLCVLVVVGVRADGTKELVAVADGERESGDAWAELLRDLRRRGMRAPVVMVGDGALGLWAALREVFPATREQRCWVHKVRNVLGALPKSVHVGARRALHEIIGAEDRAHAEQAIGALVSDYGAKWPKGHCCIWTKRMADEPPSGASAQVNARSEPLEAVDREGHSWRSGISVEEVEAADRQMQQCRSGCWKAPASHPTCVTGRVGTPARQRASQAGRKWVASCATLHGSVRVVNDAFWEVAMVVVMRAEVAGRASTRELAAR